MSHCHREYIASWEGVIFPQLQPTEILGAAVTGGESDTLFDIMPSNSTSKPPKAGSAFLFPGQGSQVCTWRKMADIAFSEGLSLTVNSSIEHLS